MSELNALPRTGDKTGVETPVPKRVGGWFSRRPGSDPHLAPFAFSALASLIEILLIALVGFVIARIYLAGRAEIFAEYVLPVPLLALSAVATFKALDLYTNEALRRFPRGIASLIFGWTLVFLLAFATIFFLKLEGKFSRVVFGSWYVTGLVLLPLTRLLIARLGASLSQRGLFRQRAVLVGGGAEAEAFLKALGDNAEHDLEIIGIFDDRGDDRSPLRVKNCEKLGTVDELVRFVRREPVDVAIFTLPVTAESRLLQMLHTLCVLPIDIRLAAHSQKLRFRPRHYLFFGAMPAFSILDRPVAGWNNLQKVLFDRVIGALMLIALSPIMLLVALAVKLDSKGPVFFKQKRFGFNNEPIEVFKFRSMFTDMSDANASKLATRDDPRITRVGRFIRRTSLDELPQLFNVVFFGNLSLVGPRPHAFQAKAADRLYEDVIDGYFARHRVKPGITGWAQINGWRGETDTPEKLQKRVEHDLHYIENWSLVFDLGIVLLTPLALIKGENAY